MAHMAKINNGIVEQVIVINNDKLLQDGIEVEEKGISFCKSLFGEETEWVQTSYNGNFRHKYAGIGDTYDKENDVFISPQPFPSWMLVGFEWKAPIEMPEDGGYYWDEDNLEWVKIIN